MITCSWPVPMLVTCSSCTSFMSEFLYVLLNHLTNLYRETRSSVLEESLRKLGVEKLSKDDVQKMQWEVLEAKIGNWIHFMRIAVGIYSGSLFHFSLLFPPTLHSFGAFFISNHSWTGQVAFCWGTQSLWPNVRRLWYPHGSVFCWCHCRKCGSVA